jgi:Carboxypeptidase regulatory-like domain
MRRVISSALIVALGVLGTPMAALAASAQGATLKGIAQGADQKPLPNYTVQVRNVANGQIAGTTTSTAAGSFSLEGLTAGNYVIEIVDAAGKVVGLSSSISIAAGATVTVTVSATAAGALLGASTGGGLSLFGLGPLATIGVISAAGVATVAGVVVAKKDASPSR